MSEYSNPEVLVSTQWVAENHKNTGVRIVESNEDVLLYKTGHIPSAIHLDWQLDLQDPLTRDYVNQKEFERLMSENGISKDTLVVFYGDKMNWWACYAFWTFKLYGHKRCAVMNGGRQKWIEEKRPLTKEVPQYDRTKYAATEQDPSIRAFREEVLNHSKEKKPLVDVRSPQEYSGELLHMPDYPQEGTLRGGHIPGAANIPWSRAANQDGTFKSRSELENIYLQEQNLKSDDKVIAYCRIGERSSHTWFVLKYLLGFSHVKNYDGSWTEWGNLVAVPIEK